MQSDPPARARDPLVSVLLPTHDRPEWLEGALVSALGGDFQDLEVIVSNNGRPEHTRRLRERVDDPRVRWVQRPPCSALENLVSSLAEARGTYVAVLHDDDWWDPRYLATLIPALEADPDAVVAFCDMWAVDAAGAIDPEVTELKTRRSGRVLFPTGHYRPFYELAIKESVPLPACAFRRDALPPAALPPEVGTAMDMWVGYRLALTGRAAHVFDERLVFNRVHEDSDFQTATMRNLVAAAECQRRMLDERRLDAHRDVLHWHVAARHQGIGATLLRQGSRREARAYLGFALRLRLTAKGLGAWLASWTVPTSMLARL